MWVPLTPQVDIVPNNQSLPIPLLAHTRSKRAIQVIPLVVGPGITTDVGVGTGIGGIASSSYYYRQLSENLAEDMEQVAKSVMTIQNQIDSLAAIVLQNQRGLDLLTAEEGGVRLFLNEECCFYTKQSGVGRDMSLRFRDRIARRRQELANSWDSWYNVWGWATWLLPLAGPLLTILLALLFGPCTINLITRFISSRMESIRLQLLVTQYRSLDQQKPRGNDRRSF